MFPWTTANNILGNSIKFGSSLKIDKDFDVNCLPEDFAEVQKGDFAEVQKGDTITFGLLVFRDLPCSRTFGPVMPISIRPR